MPFLRCFRWVVVFAVGGWLAGQAIAGGTAVRCGSTYQDRPCKGFAGKLIAPTKAQKTVSTHQAIDPACKRQGAQAQRVIAARAASVPEEDQLAGTSSAAEKRLISQVYRATGSAVEQRAAVEAGCMLERQRVARERRGSGKP